MLKKVDNIQTVWLAATSSNLFLGDFLDVSVYKTVHKNLLNPSMASSKLYVSALLDLSFFALHLLAQRNIAAICLTAVPTSGRRLRRLPEQVAPPGQLHRDPEPCREPRADHPEDPHRGVHHLSLLPGGQAAGLLGAAVRLAGDCPAEGRPGGEPRGVRLPGPHALGPGSPGRTPALSGQAALARAPAAAGACVLRGESGVG